MKNSAKDVITGVILMAFSVAYFIAAQDIKVFTIVGASANPVNAKTVPYIWAGLLFLLAAILTIRGFRETQRDRRSGENPWAGGTVVGWLKDNYAVLGTFVALAAYAFLLRKVGYLAMTALYLAVQIPLLTERGKFSVRLLVKSVVLIVVFTLVSYYVFVKLLYVRLPGGILMF